MHFVVLKKGFSQNSNFYLHPLTLSGKEGESNKLFRMGKIQNYERKIDSDPRK